MSVEVMLDLETLGNSPRGAVIQIGACVFDPDAEDAEEKTARHRFFRNVKFSSATKYGEADGDTVAWWLQQSDSARLGLLIDPVDLPSALSEFSKWWAGLGKVSGIWSHATFDEAIFRNAFESCGKRCPWRHKQVRDLRTLHSLHWPGQMEREGVHHNALDDAMFQAKMATLSIRHLRGIR